MRWALAVVGVTASLLACGTVAREQRVTEMRTPVEHGARVFTDLAASPSPVNAFSCAACHAVSDARTSRKFPGAQLAGVVDREHFWGGQEADLLAAVNHCRRLFMDAQEPWTAEDEEARALWAYLSSLRGGSPGGVPFTVVDAVSDVPAGDADEGATTYFAACQPCHGERSSGAGRMATRIPRLPDDTLAEHLAGYSAVDRRVVFVEKTRHGGFLGYGGNMPPFSAEVLTDTELGGVLAHLGLY